jgi:carbamoyltransferase
MSCIEGLRDGPKGLEKFAFNGMRVHAVERQVNPRFWSLLKRSSESLPAPVLLNTSFNLLGEPLVCGPPEAIRSFYCSGLDALGSAASC